MNQVIRIHNLLYTTQSETESCNGRCAGIATILMCYNTELRALYDLYSAKDVLWLHDASYSRAKDQRPCFGLLSLQFWQLMRDAYLLTSSCTLSDVNSVLHKACLPPPEVLSRRGVVLKSDNASGVWTFGVPLHSPFLVRGEVFFKNKLLLLFWILYSY